MRVQLPINGVPLTLLITIKTDSKQRIGLRATDNRKLRTIYQDRKKPIKGQEVLQLKMPQSPKVLDLEIYNANGRERYEGNDDPTFKVVDIKAVPLKTSPIFMSALDREFVEFAQEFSNNASFLSSGEFSPSIYRSKKGNFEIDYFNVIRDRKTRIPVSTPARIGHSTGIIEVSKKDFFNYSVPIRMIILLHEYGHKFMNYRIGKDISDEVSADITAFRIYLSLGYSEIEGLYAFLNVFKHANSTGNKKRYLILRDFVEKFNEGKFSNVSTDYKI